MQTSEGNKKKGTNNKDMMIPNDYHPFDDYVVFTKLKIPKKMKKNLKSTKE